MSFDPIVDEVRRLREEYAAQFDFNLRAIHDDLKASERENKRRTVRLQPKRARNLIEVKAR